MRSYFSPLALFFFIGSLGLAAISRGQQTTFNGSNLSNSFDNTNASARAAAMGSALTGLADDSSALFSNPAGLTYLKGGELSANSNFWLVDTFQETLLLGFPIAPRSGLGLSASYLDYGTFIGRDESGSLAANYNANRWSLKAGWGFELFRGFSLGVGLQDSQTNLAGSNASLLSADLGVLVCLSKEFRLGLDYNDLAISSSSGSAASEINLGGSYLLPMGSSDRLLVLAGGSVEPGASNYLRAGLEYGLQEWFFLRAGYQQPLSNNGIGGLNGITAGVGFVLSGLKLDYAYLPYGDLGTSHQISLGYQFDNEVQKPTPTITSTTTPTDTPTITPTMKPTAVVLTATPTQIVKIKNGLKVKFELPSAKMAKASKAQTSKTLETSSQQSLLQPRQEEMTKGKDSLQVQFDFPADPVEQGKALEKQGKDQAAMDVYAQAVHDNEKDGLAWWAMGKLCSRLGEKEKAIHCFEKLLQLQPFNERLAEEVAKYKALEKAP